MDRATVSRRLKAGRWLAGTGRNGRGQIIALPTSELARHELLVANGITQSRLEEIEQENVPARPMELKKIALALNLSPAWFVQEGATLTPTQLQAAADLLGLLPALADRARGQGPGPGQGVDPESDRPPRDVGGANG